MAPWPGALFTLYTDPAAVRDGDLAGNGQAGSGAGPVLAGDAGKAVKDAWLVMWRRSRSRCRTHNFPGMEWRHRNQIPIRPIEIERRSAVMGVRYSMRNALITALLVFLTAGAAGAQIGGSSGSDPFAVWGEPSPVKTPASSGYSTNTFQPGPPFDEQAPFSLNVAISEPTDPGTKLWWSEAIADDEGGDGLFADTQHSLIHSDALFPGLDLVRDNKSAPPFHFGVNHRFKFAEYGDERPGVRAPVGASYLWGKQGLEFFAEFGPILDVAPTTALEWNGGIGIRFNFRR